jgi:flagellar biosynthetic protein FlhB
MASDENGDKTEEPTDRRRADAREKGNVVRSVDLNAASHMLAVAFLVSLMGLPLVRAMAEIMQAFLRGPVPLTINPASAVNMFQELASAVAAGVLPWLLGMMASALAINILQVGFLLAPEALMPKFSRLNPLEGAKRILSIQSVVKLAVSLGKLLLVAGIAGWFIASQFSYFATWTHGEPAAILLAIKNELAALAMQLAIALIVLAVTDYAFQKWKHEQDLKMTKQEVRDEMKQMDGDPQMRQRRKEAHRKLAEGREMNAVQDADVVITNPTHIAVALKYAPEKMDAPLVLAKGMGVIAERIRAIAVENAIPIIERRELARALYKDVRTGHPIPVEMYEVFVEIMAYVYSITGRAPTNLDQV